MGIGPKWPITTETDFYNLYVYISSLIQSAYCLSWFEPGSLLSLSISMLLRHIFCCYTLKCLRIGTPKAINFPFVSNGKLMFLRCPSSQAHYNEAVIYLNCGTPKNNEFSIWNKWKIYYFLVSQYLSTLGYMVS